MSELIQKLEAYGADVAGAMARLLDDETLYAHCLDMLLEDENFSALEAAVQQRACTKAFEHAHALKGEVGSLGLTPLYEAVCELTDATRAGDMDGAVLLFSAVKEEWINMKAALARVDVSESI